MAGLILVFPGSSCPTTGCFTGVGHLLANLTAGTYSLQFGHVAGYASPKNGSVDIGAQTKVSINATYTLLSGGSSTTTTTTSTHFQSYYSSILTRHHGRGRRHLPRFQSYYSSILT